jgi:hypothetical protein
MLGTKDFTRALIGNLYPEPDPHAKRRYRLWGVGRNGL